MLFSFFTRNSGGIKQGKRAHLPASPFSLMNNAINSGYSRELLILISNC